MWRYNLINLSSESAETEIVIKGYDDPWEIFKYGAQ